MACKENMTVLRDKNYVLVVNDSPSTCRLYESAFLKIGCRVATAPNVSSALKIIGTENVGTVILDYTLAGINTGADFIEKLQKYGVELEIYAASSSPENNQRMVEMGCRGVVPQNIREIRSIFAS